MRKAEGWKARHERRKNRGERRETRREKREKLTSDISPLVPLFLVVSWFLFMLGW
jgi:hypothetical protein